jgi:integrase
MERRIHLGRHIGPFIGREKLSSFTMPRVYEFDAALRDNGRSLVMPRMIMTSLKSLLSHAHSQGRVAQNVARGVKIKTGRRQSAGSLQEGRDFPERAELRQLIDWAPERWRPLIVTAIFTGMRSSELRGLRWRDVDLKADLPLIRGRQRADRWCTTLGKPKSRAGSRDIPLPLIVANALKQWRETRPHQKRVLDSIAARPRIDNGGRTCPLRLPFNSPCDAQPLHRQPWMVAQAGADGARACKHHYDLRSLRPSIRRQ